MNKRQKTIEYGDRVFARLLAGGRSVAEFMIDRVGSMTELLSELRHYAGRYQGLVELYVRNLSRGWSLQQPLMLYGARSGRPAMGAAEAATMTAGAQATGRRMLFPWETH